MVKAQFRQAAFLGAVIFVMALMGPAQARDLGLSQSNSSMRTSPECDSAPVPQVNWPLWFAAQQTPQVNASFTCRGTFGLKFLGSYFENGVSSWPRASFQSTAELNADYLYAGAFWTGGIVDDDTLVSVGFEEWQNSRELYPPIVPPQRIPAPSVAPLPGPSDAAYRALLTDSLHFWNDGFEPHHPIDVPVANLSYVWRDSTLGNCIIYDAVITNIGNKLIRKACVGPFFDWDIGDSSESAQSNNGDVWNGKSGGGQDAASGIYLYRLSAGSTGLTRKMLLLK